MTQTKMRFENKSKRVITYRLAYLDREVSLCDACLEHDDHECGSIGPVQHGQHDGECDGANHEPQAAHDAPEPGC